MPPEDDEAERTVWRLLDAVTTVSSDLNLAEVLNRLVDEARSLVNARYGAIGVLADDGGQLADFIFVGIDEGTREQIGPLPTGKGVLGLLIRDPRPIRVQRLAGHPDSYGFPPNHPPMGSFLGVPVRAADGRVLGNLYLTEKQGAAEFTEHDEFLAVALAKAAANAIVNASLHERSVRHGVMVEAVRDISDALLAGDEDEAVIELAAHKARELAQADLASVAIPIGDGGSLEIRVAEGEGAEVIRGEVFPVEGSVSGDALASGHPVVLDNAAEDARTSQPVVRVGRLGPALIAPMTSPNRAFGTLAVARVVGAPRFTREDTDLLEAFARQVSVALEYGRAQRDLNRMTLLGDRERIARDLHDTVIQRLFATGMTLQGAATRAPGDIATKLSTAVDDIDDTIRQIRSTIFALEAVGREDGLRARLLRIVREVSQGCSFEPNVRFEGPIDTTVPDDLCDHVLAVVREGVSNAVRHANPTRVDVTVALYGGDLVIRVSDNGLGSEPSEPGEATGRPGGLGLRNLQNRATEVGGVLEVRDRDPQGTVLEFTVAIPT